MVWRWDPKPTKRSSNTPAVATGNTAVHLAGAPGGIRAQVESVRDHMAITAIPHWEVPVR